MKLLKDGTDQSDKTEYFRCDRCRSVWAVGPEDFRVGFAPFLVCAMESASALSAGVHR